MANLKNPYDMRDENRAFWLGAMMSGFACMLLVMILKVAGVI